MPLTGRYPRSLDEKKRIAIPRRLYEQFDSKDLAKLYVVPGARNSISLFSPSGFAEEAKKLKEESRSRTEVEDDQRLLFSRSEEVELDGQNRIRIPDRLAEFAGLQRDVMLIGNNDHAEIWDATSWERYENRSNTSV